jgi:hypothetical protein
MATKSNPPVLFTQPATLEDLIQGKDLKSKCISAKVLKEYIDYRLNSNSIPGSHVSGGQIQEEDGEF